MTRKEALTKACERHVLRSILKIPCWSGWSPQANRWLTGDLRFDYLPDQESNVDPKKWEMLPTITPFVKDDWDYFEDTNPWAHEVDPKTVHLFPNKETDANSPSFIFLKVCEYLQEEPEAVKMFKNAGLFRFDGEIEYEEDFLYKYRKPIFPIPYKDGFWDNNKFVKEWDDDMKELTNVEMNERITRTLTLLGAQS